MYYEDETGHESVVEEIGAFPKKAQAKILRFVDLMQAEGPTRLGADYSRHIDDDIWELRIDSGSDRYRVLYFTVASRTVVLLRAFLKKGKRTPPAEIATAARRRDACLRRKPWDSGGNQ
ncbi:MAG: type II toxin-antitoxin system RelE/ParE family toxin [Dehalococcoidia bacterium]|nr:type II toxin-antitoxin system RelE/ParE family toxin [Dehalococcoidia bacterium]